jgi:hypothetical protein
MVSYRAIKPPPEALRELIVADSKKFAQIIRDVGIPMEG